jgi:hypothetical protein
MWGVATAVVFEDRKRLVRRRKDRQRHMDGRTGGTVACKIVASAGFGPEEPIAASLAVEATIVICVSEGASDVDSLEKRG